MNHSRKIVLHISLSLLLILFVVILFGYWVRPLGTDGTYSQVNTLHGLPEDSVELMIYGSSRALTSVSPEHLYNAFGIGAYNYGWHWQKLNTTKAFLEDSFLSQSPRLVLIETYFSGDILENRSITAEIYYSRYLKSRSAKSNYLRQCFGSHLGRYLSYYFPVFAFHDNWSTLERQSFLPLTLSKDHLKNMGFSPLSGTNPVILSDPNTIEQQKMSDNCIKVLDEIVSLCQQNDCDILFYTIPSAEPYVYCQSMAEYAKRNGYHYLNLFDHLDTIGIDASTDFYDGGHLNADGAIKVTDFLGRYITEHYDLTDVRTIESSIFSGFWG